MTFDCHSIEGMNFIARLFYLVHRLEQAADRCFFGPHGLTMSTGRILMCLHTLKQDTPTGLAEKIGGKKSNMTQRIAMLKKAGLVKMENDGDRDRRRVFISLTEKGEEVAKKMDEIFQIHIQELEKEMTQEQKETMMTVLKLLNEKIDEFECNHA